MEKPHETTSSTVSNFLYTLTALDVKEEMVRCYASLSVSQQDSFGDKIETLSELAQRCNHMYGSRGAWDFHYMIALMRLSFRCAR